MYFRFGEIPEGEQSTIFENFGASVKGKEKGVSVYEAHKNTHGEYVPVPPSPLTELGWNDYDAFVHYRWKELPKYIVKGDLVGFGTDNEPLLRNISIIEKIERKNHDKRRIDRQGLRGLLFCHQL